MTIVVDANLAIGAVIQQAETPEIVPIFRSWRREGERLIAPFLLEYEVVSALRRIMTTGMLDQRAATKALDAIHGLDIDLIAPGHDLDKSALMFAERIGQSKAYDAQYLALASRENAPLWTADRRLASAAQSAGLGWVHWAGDWSA